MILGKRIIIAFGSLELGGAERQALLLARYLMNERGAHVQIWGFGSPGRLARLCEQYGIPWWIEPIEIPLPRNPLRLLASLIRFVRKLKKERVDILLPFTMYPNVVCGLVWRMTGAKICIWNQRDAGLDRFAKTLEHLAVLNTPLFVSNSEQGASFLVKTYGVQLKRIQVIHNGVELDNPEATRAEWRARLGLNEHCLLACMVANLSQYKDHITLLKAWRNVIDQTLQNSQAAVLLLAGRLDYTHQILSDMALRLNLAKTVRFLGQVDDVSGLLGAVDIGVFSSRIEGCPNGLLECMAAGLPVAATDIPGIRAVTGPDGYPFLAPPDNAAALADVILMFMRCAELRTNAGARNRCRIAQLFRPQQMCDQMSALIEQYA